jgi:putative two-component system response regulator
MRNLMISPLQIVEAAPPLPAEPLVLVVDDEPMLCDILLRWLKSARLACVAAHDGQQAWEFLNSHEVALVTLDINMPGRPGTEWLGQIKQKFPDTEVLMMTGYSTTQTAIAMLTQGACGFLLKPVDRGELLFQVKKALEHRELLRERRLHLLHLEDRVREQTVALRHSQEELIHRLMSATQYRDEETGAHIRRTGKYSEVLATAAGWSDAAIECIRMAAPMHDLGKVGIADAILQRAGPLTTAEFEIMKTHTRIGADILAGSSNPVLRMAHEIALTHHERWDGSGYPGGLSGELIPEAARIVSIVDVYDALTHDRVYRAALGEAEAREVLRGGRGSQFDPRLLDIFFQQLPQIDKVSRDYPDRDASAAVAARFWSLLGGAEEALAQELAKP